MMAVITCSLLMLMTTFAWGAELDSSSRAILSDWARERDQAAVQFLRSWLRGEPSNSRVAAGLTLIAREAGIAALIRDRDPDLLQRHSLLLGRRVTPETLPVVLLEQRGVRLDPSGLFAGRTFSLERTDR
jgi:hypothetical protein